MGDTKASLWFWGGTALTPDGGVLEDAAIGVEAGRIVFVGPRASAVPASGARRLDTTGCIVMPGAVNGHSHAGMSMLRGIADDLALDPWLRDHIFPLEQKWTSPEFVYWGTLLACAEMIRGGITAFNDMYFFESEAARAADEAGLRMVAGQSLVELSDVDGTGTDTARVFDTFQKAVADYKLVTPTLAPHAIYSVSEASWRCLIAYAQEHGLGIHFHLSETRREVDDCLKAYGKTPVEYLADLGLWERRVTAAHAVCLTESDIGLLGKHGVGVSYNPESNLKLATEVAPIVELRRAGVKVALGTDSTASNNNLDLFGEADFAAKLQAFRYGAGALKAAEVVGLMTQEGAGAIGLGEEVGRLREGAAADLIAVEVSAPHAVPLYDPYSHIVYSASARDVRHTVVNGHVLMEDRNLMTLDEQEILREAAAWAKRLRS